MRRTCCKCGDIPVREETCSHRTKTAALNVPHPVVILTKNIASPGVYFLNGLLGRTGIKWISFRVATFKNKNLVTNVTTKYGTFSPAFLSTERLVTGRWWWGGVMPDGSTNHDHNDQLPLIYRSPPMPCVQLPCLIGNLYLSLLFESLNSPATWLA